jgi:hypothetical protein
VVVGSNPGTVFWMVVSDEIELKINKNKGSQMGHTKKKKILLKKKH